MMQVVTCVAEDESFSDRNVKYPQISRLSPTARSSTYWKCAAVNMATAIRCFSNPQLCIYSNMPEHVIKADSRLPGWMAAHGIQIVPLPFRMFRPPRGQSTTFKNAFYKHEVLNHVAMTTDKPCVLVDCDCLWARPPNQLLKEISRGKLIAINLLDGMELDSVRNELSAVALARFFEALLKQQTAILPIWVGGELVAGSRDALQLGAKVLRDVHDRVRANADCKTLRLSNGHGIFDNDEYLATLAWAHYSDLLTTANSFAARLWTGYENCRTVNDLEFELWHLPAEKDRGFKSLYSDVMNPSSEFWKCSIDDFARYLGGHVGIPVRTVVAISDFRSRAMNAMKQVAKRLLPVFLLEKIRGVVYERK